MSNHTLCLSVCLSSCLPVFPSPAGSHRPIPARLDGGQGSKPGIFAHFHGKLQLSGGQHPEHCPQLRGEATPAQPRASSQSSSHQSHQLAFRLASSHSVPGVCAGSVVEEREMHPLHLKPLWRSWKDLNALPKKQPPQGRPFGVSLFPGQSLFPSRRILPGARGRTLPGLGQQISIPHPDPHPRAAPVSRDSAGLSPLCLFHRENNEECPSSSQPHGVSSSQ